VIRPSVVNMTTHGSFKLFREHLEWWIHGDTVIRPPMRR
jgi:hypothetical protein